MKNWAGNITFSAQTVHEPTSMSELNKVIGGASSIRALGSRHSFNPIADGSSIVDTRLLPEFLELSSDRRAVTVNGSMTYGRLAELLAPLGFSVHNLASLPHISIAGAIATGTHGSGDGNGNLATAVSALQIMTASGEVLSLHRGDPEFDGAVVSFGAVGVVTAVTLEIQEAFQIEQWVFEGPSLSEFASNFDAIFSSAYSVSAFTHWQGRADQIWVKHRPTDHLDTTVFETMAPATQNRHPIQGLDAVACTDQLGVRGLWSDRLPHFKLEFTPSAGDEIQSEFFVARGDAKAAIEAVVAISADLQAALLVSEIRTIAADDLWMSPHVERDSVGLHFTWRGDQALAEAGASIIADALSTLAPRAHWGKVFNASQFDIDGFAKREDFLSLVHRVDPDGVFRNVWFERVIEQRGVNQ
ncbi:MAG: xylitol oxidase [Verrucomicrobiales bacterium]